MAKTPKSESLDNTFPQKLHDLDKDTIEMIWRWTADHRESLSWVASLTEENRDRIDLYLALSKEKNAAHFTMIEWWTNLTWLGKTMFWVMSGVVAILLFINQLTPFLAKFFG